MGPGDGHEVVIKLLFILFGAALICFSKVNAQLTSPEEYPPHKFYQQAGGGRN